MDPSQLVDVLFRDAQVIDVSNRSIDRIDVGVSHDRIVVGAKDAKDIIYLDGAFLAPGFIDAHMHVESTMLPPTSFASLSVPHGTTTVILDPHEIANVLGIDGIKLIMEDAKNIPIDCFFTASSCVPASPFETSGATLLADDLVPLFEDDRVIALAEVMNYPAVIEGDPEVLKKIAMGLQHGLVDGHCPGLRGEDLLKYVATGISSDHESSTAEEAKEKLDAGLQIYIREGSAAKNLEALLPIITPENAHRVCFCTDDRHPDDLLRVGHIDNIVRLAIAQGLDPILAICIASKTAADHYNLPNHGAIESGRFANLVVFHDLASPLPVQTWHHGRLVAESGNMTVQSESTVDWSIARKSVHLPPNFSSSAFHIQNKGGKIRVIGLVPDQLYTEELHCMTTIVDGRLVADPANDILKIAVVERHHNTGNIGLGFVKGFQFQNGAIASTVGHDAHNIAVVGDNDEDMCVASMALEEVGGGQCVVANKQVLAILPLPLAGLMSDAPPQEVIAHQQEVLNAASRLGCPLADPFMPLSFLPLSVIPTLKLSDKGLVDVDQFLIVPIHLDSDDG